MLIQHQLQRGSATIWNTDLQLKCQSHHQHNPSPSASASKNIFTEIWKPTHLDFQQSWFIWILYLVTSNWLIESCIGISRLATCVKPNPSFLNFWGSTFVERWGKRPFWWEDSIWFTLLSLWLQKHDEMNPGRLSPSHLSSEPNWNFSADKKMLRISEFPSNSL